MSRWRSQLYLFAFGSIAIAVGIVVLFLKSTTQRLDLLAGVSIIGGLAMYAVALTHARADKDDGG